MIQMHGRVSNGVNRIIVAPLGRPPEQLKMLQEAFHKAMASPEFPEAATTLYGAEPNAEFADSMNRIIGDVQTTSEDLQALMSEYISRMEG